MSKKKWCYILVMLTCLIVFLNLELLVQKFVKTSANHLVEADFSDYQSKYKDPVYYDILSTKYNKDDFETVSFNGLAGLNTTEDNAGREISLIFKSNTHCYVSTKRGSFGNPLVEIRNKMGLNYSFRRDISTLPMKNDQYRLYIYCKENDTNYGIIDTGRTFVKEKNNFYEKKGITLDNFDPNVLEAADPKARLHVSRIYEDSIIADRLLIEGWIINEGQDSTNQEVYVELSFGDEKIYRKADMVERPDVDEAFNSNLYSKSGFSLRVDTKLLADAETFSLQVIMKKDEQYYLGGAEYKYDIATKQIEVYDLTK